jgi:hypothetical protein
MGVMLVSLLILWFRFRRLPVELLRFWIFREHGRLRRAFTGIGLGSLSGWMTLAPSMLGLSTPVLWYVGFLAPWAVGVSYGFFTYANLEPPSALKGRR